MTLFMVHANLIGKNEDLLAEAILITNLLPYVASNYFLLLVNKMKFIFVFVIKVPESISTATN